VVRRFVMIAISFSLVLAVGVTGVDQLFAQGEAKKDAQPPAVKALQETAKPDASKPEATKTAASKPDDTKKEAAKTEPPLPPIPPAVQAKLEAARKAVAELIVAAQDANLVETSIDPPPILDILIKGRATDLRILKDTTAKKPYGLSPEVFGAWFTGYGKLDGVNYADDVRIVNPSAGLKDWYDERARILGQYIQDIRKTKGPAPTATKDAAKPAEATKPSAAPAPASAPAPSTKPAAEPKKN
jgi:hypothetical protein